MSERNIVRRNLSDRREGKTDWARLGRKTEDEIKAEARSDPDSPLWTKDELRGARLVIPSGEIKIPVSIRLDGEVIEYFKTQGPGYQSRIAAVLLSYVRTHAEEQLTDPGARKNVVKAVSSRGKEATAAKRTAGKGTKRNVS